MKSLLSKHFPMTMLCLAVAWSCSEDDGSPEKAVGAATGSGGSGGSAVASGAGSGGSSASATGGTSSGEMGGSNGLAQPGTSSSSSAAQGGSAGSASMADAGGSAGAAPETDAGAGAADSGAALVSYARDIQPILLADCSPCHATDRDGGHNAATSYADAVRVSADIVREISSGGMPESGAGNQGCNRGDPGDPGCVSAADFALIQRWIADGTPQ